MLLRALAIGPTFLALVLWSTFAEGALYRTASIGGAGGDVPFDDLTVLESLSDYRPRNILLWQECANGGLCNVGSGFTGFEPSHAICESGCYIKWERKRVVSNWPDNGPTSAIALEHGDFVQMMYGYIKVGEDNRNGLYLLNGVGTVVQRRGAQGEREEIFAGYREGMYVEVLGPLVAFWGNFGAAFDQLGAYMDPSVWPERPSRLVIREMHGVLVGGALTDTYFSSVNASGRPYAMRLLSATVSYNDTSIIDIAAVFQDDLGGTIQWRVGTGGAYTEQMNIVNTGSASIDGLHIAMHDSGGGDCLNGIVVKLAYPNGTSEDMVFGSNPMSYYTTDAQIVGFHGIAGEECIRRLGVYTQMDSSELKDTCQLPSLSRLADNVTLALDADLPERIQNGTEIMFACSDGFALTRGRVLTCGDDGIWQGVLPECAPVVPRVSVSVTTEAAVTVTEPTTVTATQPTTVMVTKSVTVTQTVTTSVTTGSTGLGPDAPASAIWSSCQYFLIPFIVVLGVSLILLLVLVLVLGILCRKLRNRHGYKEYPTGLAPFAELSEAVPNPLFEDYMAKPQTMTDEMGMESQEMRLHISETDMQKELV